MSVEQNISEEQYVCRYNCIEITGYLYKIYERIKIYALKTLELEFQQVNTHRIGRYGK